MARSITINYLIDELLTRCEARSVRIDRLKETIRLSPTEGDIRQYRRALDNKDAVIDGLLDALDAQQQQLDRVWQHCDDNGIGGKAH